MFFLFRFSLYLLKLIFYNEAFRIFLAVFFGALLSFITYLFIEWYKNKNSFKSWLLSLTVEVSHNYEMKRKEVEEIKSKFSGIPEGFDIFETYRNSFDIFFAFLKSGYSLKAKKIVFEYSSYVNNEIRHIVFRKSWFDENVKPNILRNHKLVSVSADFPGIDLILKKDIEQLNLIKKVFDLLKKETRTFYKEGE